MFIHFILVSIKYTNIEQASEWNMNVMKYEYDLSEYSILYTTDPMYNFNTYVKLLLLMMWRIYLLTTFAYKYYVFINCFCNDLHTRFRLSAFRNLIIIMTIIIRSIGNQSQCKPDFPYKTLYKIVFFSSSLHYYYYFALIGFNLFKLNYFKNGF